MMMTNGAYDWNFDGDDDFIADDDGSMNMDIDSFLSILDEHRDRPNDDSQLLKLDMMGAEVRQKRGRKAGSQNVAFEFIPGLKLSQHPPEQRKELFIKKLHNIVKAKSLHPTEFEGYTIRERFAKMGWEQLLNFECDKIYRRVVIEWMASLSKEGDELIGMVDGKSYTITPTIIREILGVDTRRDLPYARFSKHRIDENGRRWLEACNTVFGLNEKFKPHGWYLRQKMTPLVKILWRIGVFTFHPRLEDVNYVWPYEIHLLHALFTGDYLYSFAHLMIDDIWYMYEDESEHSIPHGYYISEILNRLGAVSKDECAEIVAPQYRVISRMSFFMELEFSETPTEYIIDDKQTEKRVTFPKKVINGEAPRQPLPQFPRPPIQNMPRHVPIPNPHDDLENLLTNLQTKINKQVSQYDKQLSKVMTKVTNIQKQIEHQALEAERREQEREKRAEEREKRAEERERRAEIRAHAIIWDIERQRYYYEQEQEQLRMAWNEFTGVDEFKFPEISVTSFHPPQEGSQYYDPTRSNDIPKALQSIYHDIYGPRR